MKPTPFGGFPWFDAYCAGVRMRTYKVGRLTKAQASNLIRYWRAVRNAMSPHIPANFNSDLLGANFETFLECYLANDTADECARRILHGETAAQEWWQK